MLFFFVFLATDVLKCDTDTCVGLSSGTASLYIESNVKEIGKLCFFFVFLLLYFTGLLLIFFTILYFKKIMGSQSQNTQFTSKNVYSV